MTPAARAAILQARAAERRSLAEWMQEREDADRRARAALMRIDLQGPAPANDG